MSESFDKGRNYERKIQKITSKILHLDVKRDSRSGAGLHKADVRDRYNELPIFIECKDQKTLKLKEWWNDADNKSSHGQAPIVVFPYETTAGLEDLACMRYTDLLQLIREMMDWKETADDYRQNGIMDQSTTVRNDIPKTVSGEPVKQAEEFAKQAASQKPKIKLCRNEHIADDYGYCQIKDCKFRRGYKPKKEKKKR